MIEAVTENLAIKQALLEKIAPHLKPDVILTTNTSGLPIASIAAKLPEHLRRRWFGTHFFNPPRYMRLVEIIATPETDPAAVDAVSHFADLRLGKEVVFARDTPNFIANRIGVFIMLEAVRLMQAEDLTIEEVDALTGTAIGWPRTGTFRLADLVGLDVLAHVAANFPRSHAGSEQMAHAAVRPDHARAALAGRQNQTGLLQEGEGQRGQGSPPRARLEDAGIPAGRAAQAALARNGQERRAACRSAWRNCSRATSGRTKRRASTGGC